MSSVVDPIEDCAQHGGTVLRLNRRRCRTASRSECRCERFPFVQQLSKVCAYGSTASSCYRVPAWVAWSQEERCTDDAQCAASVRAGPGAGRGGGAVFTRNVGGADSFSHTGGDGSRHHPRESDRCCPCRDAITQQPRRRPPAMRAVRVMPPVQPDASGIPPQPDELDDLK